MLFQLDMTCHPGSNSTQLQNINWLQSQMGNVSMSNLCLCIISAMCNFCWCQNCMVHLAGKGLDSTIKWKSKKTEKTRIAVQHNCVDFLASGMYWNWACGPGMSCTHICALLSSWMYNQHIMEVPDNVYWWIFSIVNKLLPHSTVTPACIQYIDSGTDIISSNGW
jgi:hypothetical protein